MFRVERMCSLLGDGDESLCVLNLRFFSYGQKQWHYSSTDVHGSSSLLSQLPLDNRPCSEDSCLPCGKTQKRGLWSSVTSGKSCKHNSLEWAVNSRRFAPRNHSLSLCYCLILWEKLCPPGCNKSLLSARTSSVYLTIKTTTKNRYAFFKAKNLLACLKELEDYVNSAIWWHFM